MFYGRFNHTVDDKGRLIIPAKFRSACEDKFFITAGIEQCLYVFREPEWRVFEQKLRSLPMARDNARTIVRRFFSMTSEVVCDKLGRIGLPASLIEYAGLRSDVVIAGVGERFEVWSGAAWEKVHAAGSLEQVAEELAELNLL